MTEKRFTLTFDDKIVDNLTGITHDVHSGYDVAMDLTGLLNSLHEENEQLKSFKNDVHDLIDELIIKAEKDVEDLRKDAYEKGYAYNPYYYWGVAHGLEKLKKELEE